MNAVGLWMCPCKFTECRGPPQPATFTCTECRQPLSPADPEGATHADSSPSSSSNGAPTFTNDKAYCLWYRAAPAGAARSLEAQGDLYCRCACPKCQAIDQHDYSQCWNVRGAPTAKPTATATSSTTK